ncbi:MAG: NHL repeat-containing protein [Thermoleophilia bacterium]|nr:NHL repeat-containing protein [Thermoleophilia bacterium]
MSALVFAALLASGASEAGAAVLKGRVTSGDHALPGLKVKLVQSRPGARRVETLGTDMSGRGGSFRIRYSRSSSPGAQFYVTALTPPHQTSANAPKGSQASFNEPRKRPRGTLRLGAFLGSAPYPKQIVINERTTVAAGFGLAQFTRHSRTLGPAPGIGNAGLMAANLANVSTGGISTVLKTSPNGSETETLRTFNSLANLIAPCARHQSRCDRLFKAADVTGEKTPRGVLDAVAMIARNPWHNVAGLFRMSRSGPAPYSPTLASADQPSAWTVALRFDGDGKTMNGPGNFAVDAKGNLWVVNNYNYSPDPFQSVCGSDLLLKFTPDGRYVPGSPYTGGGLSGAGFGVTLDPEGRVWVGNYGFSARGCTVEPPHNSVSEIQPSGKPISPDTGYTAGKISWPQGTVSDRAGNIWIANCGNDSVTYYPRGNPHKAKNLTGLGLTEPFDIAIGKNGKAFVTGIGNDAVAVLNRGAKPAAGSPNKGGGLDQPMGISSDQNGNLWVSNSGLLSLPCPKANISLKTRGGSMTLLDPQGQPKRKTSFTGGGLTIPWGNAIDGNNTVWVANFGKQRISQFCGTTASRCPRGKRTGDPISPNGTGYGFDGLTRVTGVAIDPSGNVWATNNWKVKPVQTNPGGYQIVAFVGAAGPVKTPLIGLPARP